MHLFSISSALSRDPGGVIICVCVITKPERFWPLQHVKYSLVSLCGVSAAGQQT